MDYDRLLASLRERIDESEDISGDDRDALEAFSDRLSLLGSSYTQARHVKLLRHCTLLAENVGGLARALEERDAAEAILRYINDTYDNEETNRDYRVAIRVFGRRATEENGDEPPESIDWIPSGTSKSYNPQPSPGDMLLWEQHVLPMIEACHNNRDKAMIAVAWDSGARSGEFRALIVGDVTEHKHGLQVTVDGKRGQRTVTLIPSVPWLQRWLSDHPSGDRADPLWSKVHEAEGLTHTAFTRAFRAAAERAGVDRPVTLTNFRKSSASYLASQGMSQAHLEEHHGWVRGSTVASRYVAIFGDAAGNELARIHGKDVSDDTPDPIAPVPCPRCGESTPRELDFCLHCQQALDLEAKQLVDSVTERLDDLAIVSDDPDDRRDILRARRTLDEKPNTMDRDELHHLVISLSPDDGDED